MALIEKKFQEDIDHNFKCFLYCLYYKYNWMSEDGAFINDKMKESLTESNLDEPSVQYLVDTCVEIGTKTIQLSLIPNFLGIYWKIDGVAVLLVGHII